MDTLIHIHSLIAGIKVIHVAVIQSLPLSRTLDGFNYPCVAGEISLSDPINSACSPYNCIYRQKTQNANILLCDFGLKPVHKYFVESYFVHYKLHQHSPRIPPREPRNEQILFHQACNHQELIYNILEKGALVKLIRLNSSSRRAPPQSLFSIHH